MQSIDTYDFRGKKALIRVDFKQFEYIRYDKMQQDHIQSVLRTSFVLSIFFTVLRMVQIKDHTNSKMQSWIFVLNIEENTSTHFLKRLLNVTDNQRKNSSSAEKPVKKIKFIRFFPETKKIVP